MQIMVDFHACSWPEGLDAASPSLAMHFDQMNAEPVADVVSACTSHAASSSSWPPVITFSHFLPLQVYSHLILICAKLTMLGCCRFCCCSQHVLPAVMLPCGIVDMEYVGTQGECMWTTDLPTMSLFTF